jgi:hypothetical protein
MNGISPMNNENPLFYEIPCLRASPRHGGAKRSPYCSALVIDPPWGCAVGGGGIHRIVQELSP